MANPMPEIERFLKDRLLDQQPFNPTVSQLNLIEELLESMGWHDNKERDLSKHIRFMLMYDLRMAVSTEQFDDVYFEEPSVDDILDARADNIVFSIDDIMKLGYDPSAVLLEVAKEINSREGEIVNGKFTKFKTEEAMAKWHKADFTNCKRK